MATANLESPNHFNPAIRIRLNILLTERYIHTPQNAELWCLLEDLMFQVSVSSPKPKVMGCLITGEPHSGKTTAVRQFKQAYLENVTEAQPNDIFLFQIPSRARLKGVMTKMGIELNIPDIEQNSHRDYPTFRLIQKVASKLWKNGVKLVILDEFQKLFDLPGESRVEILGGFNDLVNESHIPIVLVGVVGVDQLLDIGRYERDEGNLRGCFSSRFSEFRLLAWEDPHNPKFAILLKTIYDDCNLIPPPNTEPFFMNESIRELILSSTGGLTGKIISLIKWSTRYIIRNNLPEIITIDILKQTLKSLQVNGW
jgi:hypothetical protein